MKTSAARAVWLDYLRSFVTLLVIAHHAALAYPTFAFFDRGHYIWSTAPIVDTSRWVGTDIFIGANDIFFMPLMFLISGLFVYRGLLKKGTKGYLADRFVRLGIPFLIAEVVLIPVAYLPSFYEATGSVSFVAFVQDYLVRQQWPVGPPWFIWLLLAFDGLATLTFAFKPTFFSTTGRWFAILSEHPFRFGIVIYGLVCLSLIPLSLKVGQYTWVGDWGPFDFQLNRLLFYFFFFGLGATLGATDWQEWLFRQGKLLGNSWSFWLGLSIVCYGLVMFESDFGREQVKQGNLTPAEGFLLYDLAFVGSCLASMSACLSVFRTFIIRRLQFWDNLSANAYGIYIVHYGFVTWLQFVLLPIEWAVMVKFTVVFTLALVASWIVSSLARRSTRIAQFI